MSFKQFKRVSCFYKNGVFVLLIAGVLGGCSSDFSRFTDGVQKSSPSRRKVASVASPVMYPPAPIRNSEYNRVESSALEPLPAVVDSAATSPIVGETVNTGRGGSTEPRSFMSMNTGTGGTGASSADVRSSVYKVRKGDNLIGIARHYDVSVNSIKRNNGLKNDRIFVGQRLTVIGGGAVASAATVAVAKKSADRIPALTPEPEQNEEVQTGSNVFSSANEQNIPPSGGGQSDNYGKGFGTAPMKAIGGAGMGVGGAAVARQDNENKEKEAAKSASDGTSVVSASPVPAASIAEKNTESPSTALMIWPVAGSVVSSYGQRSGTGTNDGMDIAVSEGTKIYAADSGVVIYAGDGLKEFGNTILIRHDNNIVTVYGHNSKLLVQRGQQVARGEAIALSGSSGNASAPKLHFEVRQNSAPVNPMKYLPAAH